MKAAILKAFGSPLAVETLADPILGTGEVIVDVVAAGVLPYANEVFSGERKYMLTLPMAPGAGAVGRVRAIGPDSTRLAVGDWVTCDPTVRARDDAMTPDTMLQGWSARGEGRLQKHFHHGSFADVMDMALAYEPSHQGRRICSRGGCFERADIFAPPVERARQHEKTEDPQHIDRDRSHVGCVTLGQRHVSRAAQHHTHTINRQRVSSAGEEQTRGASGKELRLLRHKKSE